MDMRDATYSSASEVFIMGAMTSSTISGSAFLLSMNTDGTLNYGMTYNCTYLLKSLAFDSSTSNVYFKCGSGNTVQIAKIDTTDGSVVSLVQRSGTLKSNYVYNDMKFNPVNNKVYFNAFFLSPHSKAGFCDMDFN